MSGENKMKNTNNNKKSDGKFKSKHINHDPQNESSRVKFGLGGASSDSERTARENKA